MKTKFTGFKTIPYASYGVVVAAALGPISAFAQTKTQQQRQTSQEVYWSALDEAPSMDPTKQADTISGMWLGHIYEGLMTYDKTGKVVPGTAEKMVVSADKKTITFSIRKNAKWHDGKAVRAQDFEFAWKRLVDPAFASEYAFIATVAALQNAEDIIAKKLPIDKLGVKSLDDHTLQVTLARPVAFFDSLMAFQVFDPIRQDLVQKYGDKFATATESIVGNGPFKLVAWQKEQSMRIEKADTYWNAAAIKLKAIESPSMVKDAQANFNNFQTGGIDLTNVNTTELIKQSQNAKLKIEAFPTGCLDYIELNTRAGRVFADEKLRKAMRIGLNRNEFIHKIIGVPGYLSAFGIVPDFMPGSKANSTYRREAPIQSKDGDLAGAKKLIQETLAASGKSQIPSFTILANDSSRVKKFAEYYQNSLSKLFNTQVKIETVPFKSRLQRSRDGQFDIAISGWCPDYRDPMTFMDLYTSKNENNTSGWSNAKFDSLIEKAANEGDLAARVKIFAEAEAILIDQAPLVPTDQAATPYVAHKSLRGVRRAPFGADPDFRFAEWAP